MSEFECRAPRSRRLLPSRLPKKMVQARPYQRRTRRLHTPGQALQRARVHIAPPACRTKKEGGATCPFSQCRTQRRRPPPKRRPRPSRPRECKPPFAPPNPKPPPTEKTQRQTLYKNHTPFWLGTRRTKKRTARALRRTRTGSKYKAQAQMPQSPKPNPKPPPTPKKPRRPPCGIGAPFWPGLA